MKSIIFGLGVSGKGVIRYFLQKKEEFIIVDDKVTKLLEDDLRELSIFSSLEIEKQLEQLVHEGYRTLILSPGIARSHPLVIQALALKISVINDIELAFANCSLPIVAVTGSNGKTTTVTMITELLELAGLRVFCGGNIGVAALDFYLTQGDYDLVVLELSSFQLESIDLFKPTMAFILNITANHQERYEHLNDYAKAKWNIFKNMDWQRGEAWLGGEVEIPDNFLTVKSHFKRIQKLDDHFNFSHSKLLGSHQRQNFFCAFKVLSFFDSAGLYSVKDVRSIMQTFIDQFRGPSYRMEQIYESRELIIFNDAKSTNFTSTIKAIDTAAQVNTKERYLIIGGKKRISSNDQELEDILKYLNDHYPQHFTTIYIIGEAADLSEERRREFADKYCFSLKFSGDLKAVIDDFSRGVMSNNVSDGGQKLLLFSPGFPSFDQFSNYLERGQHFNRAVQILCNKKH